MNKKVGILIAALMLTGSLGLMTGCGTQGTFDNSAIGAITHQQSAPNPSVSETVSSAGSQAWLPASFTAYNNQYNVDKVSIAINEDDNTVVTCEGSGFDKLPMRNNAYQMPLACLLIVDGDKVSWSSGSANDTILEFIYEGAYDPDSVILMAGDNGDQRVLVPVNKTV